MARPKYPSDKQDQFMVRLPEGMRDQIAGAAEQNGRSMNAEIVSRLDLSFRFGEGLDRFIASHEELEKNHLELNKQFSALESEYEKLNMELAATKAALIEQKTISFSLQSLLSENLADSQKRAEQDEEAKAAIEARYNEMKEQAVYLESLKVELLNLSRERQQVQADAEHLADEQSKVIDRLSQDHKATAKVLIDLHNALRKAASGDDTDLAEIVSSFAEETGSRQQP
ncbi:Arc family DNA-binding protein [Rhizobium sp. NLR4a]|uniref:Arc family DNA-binding protein n=1 Tax=Rhizobium sp. NLR4a TaxID=2731117 RepID=UPI001C83376F|nr:Arc family DNA-binding protein [Rhizobium sp. NLR4a]MBX5236279.1 Arc family DNA-binding protein [Rhizobium sp. NLR4a]